MTKRLIVGISGASGAPLALALLQKLQDTEFETHLIVTRGGKLTLEHETQVSYAAVCSLANVVYDLEDIGAAPASGSFATCGMIVVPCSMKTVAGIWSGYSDNLLLRAADVTLKEQRRLVLVPRETPLSSIHLRNLSELSQMGATIVPPVINYYNKPKSIADATDQMVEKLLDLFDAASASYRRWKD